MNRGDLLTAALQGEHGKPRPAVVIESTGYNFGELVALLPMTSDLVESQLIRPTVLPTKENGLYTISQVMVDRITTALHSRLGPVFGRLDQDTMREIDRSLALYLGLMDERGNISLPMPRMHRKTDF